MALNLIIHVETTTATYTVPITQRLIVNCEAKYGDGFPKILQSQKMTPIMWCAYEGTRLSGTTVPQFDKWVDDLIEVRLEAGDDPKGS